MKKNIVIAVLICIIVVLVIKLLNPSVVTQRKSDTSMSQNIKTNQIHEDYGELNKSVKNTMFEESQSSPLMPEYRINNSDRNNFVKQNDSYNEYAVNPTNSSSQNSNYAEQTQKNVPPQYQDNNQIYEREKPLTIIPQTPIVKRRTLEHSLSMCIPYKETLTTEYMGVNMKYTIDIVGWQGNKCILNFEANMLDTGSGFEDYYGVSAESAQVFGFAPKVRCEFTQKQLVYVGDNILEEKNTDRKMLKNPNQINLPNANELTFSDIKLLQVIFNDKACKIVNSDDFVKLFESLFQF